ncbi:MAG: 4Fe-4S dicluster domain-containing protein [Clostridia bacterium]|jgi:formate dehydrogenase iron-sulfur subunit|nr:4Fe-4S dicluster domain-containing protein [Clostridia bacterium]MCL6522584.1 4Fe-4S dicluster domain-containing protein [Bacillota bacterium]
MAEVSILVDVTKCIGCKSCEVACKQWWQLPAEIGSWTGSYQSHDDLSYHRWTMVLFREKETASGGVEWLFRKEQCMHCENPACVAVCPTQALTRRPDGIVDLDPSRCTGCQYCVEFCPFGIPRYDPAANKVAKCNMCADRVDAGMEPACVQACPTDALTFGPRPSLLAAAEARVAELGQAGVAAQVYNPQEVGGTHYVYVLPQGEPADLGFPARLRYPATVGLWKSTLQPVGEGVAALSLAVTLAAAATANLLHRNRGEGGDHHE